MNHRGAKGYCNLGGKFLGFVLTFGTDGKEVFCVTRPCTICICFYIGVFVVFIFLSHCKWVFLFLMCFYHLVELGVGSVLRCDVM